MALTPVVHVDEEKCVNGHMCSPVCPVARFREIAGGLVRARPEASL